MKCSYLLFSTIAIATMTIAGCSASKDAVQATPKEYSLLIANTDIVYSANINGEMEPCGCRSNPTGGMPRRLNIENTKLIHKDSKLSVDSGDTFYKSAPIPALLIPQWNAQAESIARSFKALGVSYFTPGELDFAAGVDQLIKLLRIAGTKAVCANISYKGSNKSLFPKSVTFDHGGKKISIIGLYDETIPLPDSLTATSHIEAAKEIISKLRSSSDVIIVLSHLGLEKDRQLANAVSGIDAIFGAHSQSFLIDPVKIGNTLIFQPSFRGQHLGHFENGKNHLYQVDARFDSPEGQPNSIDLELKNMKAEIAKLNKESDQKLFSETEKTEKNFQTFASCAQCHVPQYEFHKKTPHFKAYETLVKKSQNHNLECLKCHTVGMDQPGGWVKSTALVLGGDEKPIQPEKFANSLQNMNAQALAKVKKTFLNVQCENCHGSGDNHPFSGKLVHPKPETCLQCHTKDQAPTWYSTDGSPNLDVIRKKLTKMACPRDK